MNTWLRSWGFSIGVHIFVGMIIAFLYLHHTTDILPPPKAIEVRIGSVSTMGQGGTIANEKQLSNHKESVEDKQKLREKLLQSATTAIEEVEAETPSLAESEQTSDEQDDSQDSSIMSNDQGSGDNGVGQNDGDKGSGAGSSTGTDALANSGFERNGDGSYTAPSPDGLTYTILRQVEAQYPEQAKEVNYSRTVVVHASMLVGLNGTVESVTILNSPPNLGFAEATKRALFQWKFAPITYKGHPIKMRFRKSIRFEPN